MMTAAAEGCRSSRLSAPARSHLLTSMDSNELAGIGITASPADQVLRLARLARASGIDGMVCSAEEGAMLRKETSPDTLLVIPGIRPAGSAVGDQKRVATPAQAIADGASMLVVGRPHHSAVEPAAAARSIFEEIEQATKIVENISKSWQVFRSRKVSVNLPRFTSERPQFTTKNHVKHAFRKKPLQKRPPPRQKNLKTKTV